MGNRGNLVSTLGPFAGSVALFKFTVILLRKKNFLDSCSIDFQIFFKVMGPQILRHALPGIGNVWQITLKDTSLISVTGLVEIMRQTRIASNVEHSPLTFLVTAALLYLFLTTFSGKFFKVLELNYSKGYN